MLSVVQAQLEPPLVGARSLPKYEFVQDIEDFPDIAIELNQRFKATVKEPVDSYWFFELDTPKVEKKMLDLRQAPAAAAASASLVPIATPGSYQLFLPDPEMMDRVGEVSPSEIYQSADSTPPIPVALPQEPPPEASALLSPPPIEGEDLQRGRRSRSSSKGRRVVIADPPVSGSQSPPRDLGDRSERNRSSTRIVSYQRPKESSRSQSRSSRIARALATQPTSSYTERRTMDNLTASMKSASELLERRRNEGASRYVDSLYDSTEYSLGPRGRAAVRSSYVSTSSDASYRNSALSSASGGPSAAEASGSGQQASGGSLWGLLDMAQSWLMKPRRDRSEEKVKSLIRKSRHY